MIKVIQPFQGVHRFNPIAVLAKNRFVTMFHGYNTNELTFAKVELSPIFGKTIRNPISNQK